MKNEEYETKMHTSLNDMPRRNAFVVPEGYFEELPTAVLEKSSVSKVEKVTLFKSKPLWWSVAACGLLLLGIWFVVPNTTPPSANSLLAENTFFIDVDRWNDYVIDHICPTIIEDELFAENIDFTAFLEDFTSEDFWDFDDFLTYADFDIYDI
jgi:hypothetical protein